MTIQKSTQSCGNHVYTLDFLFALLFSVLQVLVYFFHSLGDLQSIPLKLITYEMAENRNVFCVCLWFFARVRGFVDVPSE